MKINRVEGFLVRLPLQKPYRIADQEIESCETVYVMLQSGDVCGWGEVTPGNTPYLTSAWSHGVFLTIKQCLLPLLTERLPVQIESGKSLQEVFDRAKGNRHAKAAFDLAWWDLQAKLKGVPLWKLLGGNQNPIEVGLSIDRTTDQDAYYQALNRIKEENYRRLTLKMRPGWDIQIVNLTRMELPSAIKLQVDLEGALDIDNHSDTLYRLDDFFLTLVEQPLSTPEYVGHAILQDSMRVPICLDESIKTLAQANIAIDLQSAGYFCLKTGRVGGLTEGKAIHDLAAQHEVDCYGGFDLQSSIGYRHLLALASLEHFALPCDYIRFDEVFAEEPAKPILSTVLTREIEKKPFNSGSSVVKVTESYRGIELWDEPGIGCEPNREIIDKYTLEKFVWE